MPRRSTQRVRRVEITSTADRHTLEALQLEIRRLAREYGFEVTDVRIGDVEDDGPPQTDCAPVISPGRSAGRRCARSRDASRSR
jgi:hypothetical protein